MATKPEFESTFLRITSQKIADIRKRSQAKYTQGGKRLLRPEIPVEFTLGEFRAWVIQQFGDEWGAKLCHYGCGRWLTPEDFIPDHYRALNRGGRNSLDNLVACCQQCNDEKGEMHGDWYLFFRKCLNEMPDEERNLIRGRLMKSEKLASSVRFLRREFLKSKSPKQQEQL